MDRSVLNLRAGLASDLERGKDLLRNTADALVISRPDDPLLLLLLLTFASCFCSV